MPKYKVLISQKNYGDIIVEAEDANQASEKAKQMVWDGWNDWNDTEVDDHDVIEAEEG